MDLNHAWLNCVVVAALSGLVKSILTHQGLKKPSYNAEVIHLGAVQDVGLAGLLGYLVYCISPFDQTFTLWIAALVGFDPQCLTEFIRDWVNKK